MKTHRTIFFSVGVWVSTGLLALGQFQAEFSATARRPAPPVSDTSQPLPPETPLTLRMIVGTDEADVDERSAAVHALGRNLSRGEIAALYVFLKSPPGTREKNLPALRVLKNDLLDVLLEQTVPPKGLTDTMIGIYQDPAQDGVSRDYAVQHLVTWYELGASDAPGAKAKIRAVLREAAREKSGLAGTALLGWHRLSQHDKAFDPEEINRLAVCLAQSAETETATRITAIQVCAERGLKEVLPAIESLAQAPGCLPLRLSAIAALGRLGGPEPARQWRQIAGAPDATVRGALPVALRQMERKERLD